MKMNLRGVLFVAGICVLGSLGMTALQEDQSATAFHWLDDRKDSEVLAMLRKEFRAELVPGEQNKPRRLRRAGVFGNSAIVIIDSDETEVVEGERRYDYFSTAYNFDLSSGKKLLITTTGTSWKWSFLSLSRFEGGPAPDIVFTYFDCVDCEATHILGSYQYEAENKAWRIRQWGKTQKGINNEGIFIGSNAQYGDFLFRYATLFKVQDFDGDNFDDVMVWSREKAYKWENENKLHSAKDTFVVYSIKAGEPVHFEPKGAERKRFQNLLCTGNKNHELCRTAKLPAVKH